MIILMVYLYYQLIMKIIILKLMNIKLVILNY